MKISGILPLRNAIKLQYPFEIAIASLRPLCDELVIGVDPTSEDDTLKVVRALRPDRIVESAWNMDNHQGHTNCEITVQTQKLCDAAQGDWIFSLQADELLHEDDLPRLRRLTKEIEVQGGSALELQRLYFYQTLEQLRRSWTLWMVRLFKRGCWKPDVDGAMRFDPVDERQRKYRSQDAAIYHYSRVGDGQIVAERVRNLDRFFHAPSKVKGGSLEPYDFRTTRKLDSYVVDHVDETDQDAGLEPFERRRHPALAQGFFR